MVMLPLNLELMKLQQVKYNKVDGTTDSTIQVPWKPQVAKIKPMMLPLNVQLMMIPQVKYNNYFDKVDGTTGTYCYTGIMEASCRLQR